jgi:hypothetical protein
MLLTKTLLLVLISAFATADIRFLTPASGSSVHGDGALSVSWEASGTAPTMDDLISYQLFLCAGGNDDATIVQLAAIVLDGHFTETGTTAEAVIPSSIGASNPKNA